MGFQGITKVLDAFVRDAILTQIHSLRKTIQSMSERIFEK